MSRTVEHLCVPLASFLLIALATAACRGRLEAGAVHRGPIVLITLEGVRADVVGALGGAPGLTPNLDALSRSSDWSGAAIAPSSGPVASVVSLLTGLPPSLHGAVGPDGASLPEDLVTLGELLAARGFRTWGYTSNPALSRPLGFGQGLDPLRDRVRLGFAQKRLAALDGGPELAWIHLARASPPWLLHDAFVDRVERPAAGLPRHFRRRELESLAPAAEVRERAGSVESQRDAAWALYRMNVAAADHQVGLLLKALERSGLGSQALVVVAGTCGVELGEAGASGYGNGLSRYQIEVPLLLRLPDPALSRLLPATGARPSLLSLFATLAEAAGAEPAPAVAPSFERSVSTAALAELFLASGERQRSLVGSRFQLERISAAGVGEHRERLLEWLPHGVRPAADQGGGQALRLQLDAWEARVEPLLVDVLAAQPVVGLPEAWSAQQARAVWQAKAR